MGKVEAQQAPNSTYILVTGTNSGLGLATCCRLIDEFLDSRPPSCQLVLILTTRDTKKGHATRTILKRHLCKHRSIRPTLPFSDPRVIFRLENLELTSLVSVKNLAARLRRSAIPRLDAVILNASLAGSVGLNWPLAIWSMASDPVQALTWPTYKQSAIGLITKSQLPPVSKANKLNHDDDEDEEDEDEPVLGQIFCANVFGHYMLAHWLMPLLRACPHSRPGRIIWVSSVSGDVHHFNKDDIQGLESRDAYEHTKRMTDLLALTSSRQPATDKSVKSFLHFDTQAERRFAPATTATTTTTTTSSSGDNSNLNYHPTLPSPSTPSITVAHPGICATAIFPLPWPLLLMMTLTFYLVRWLGSPWHNVTAYAGATAACWLALADPAEIADREKNGAVKWGSAVTRSGEQSVQRTDTPGWGVCGDVGDVGWWCDRSAGWLSGGAGRGWGRKRGSRDPSREDVESFVEDGAFSWRALEELRVEWEKRIDRSQTGREEKG